MTDDEVLNRVYDGWKAVKVTSGGAETVAVTTGQCKLGKVLTLGAINVIPKDDTVALWDAIVAAVPLDIGSTPIAVRKSLNLTFSALGSAWVFYQPWKA